MYTYGVAHDVAGDLFRSLFVRRLKMRVISHRLARKVNTKVWCFARVELDRHQSMILSFSCVLLLLVVGSLLFVAWLFAWLFACLLVGSLFGWLVRWLVVGWFVRSIVGWLVRSFVRATNAHVRSNAHHNKRGRSSEQTNEIPNERRTSWRAY